MSPLGGKQRSAAVRAQCRDQVNRACMRSALFGIPAAALLAVILGDALPLSTAITFVTLVAVADIASLLASTDHLRRRRRGDPAGPTWIGPATSAAIGAAWASLPLLASPDSVPVELLAVYLLFICAVSATTAIGTAAEPAYFWAGQLPLLVVAVVFVTGDDTVTRLLGVAIPVWFVVVAVLHHEVHTVVVSELELTERNEEVNRRLVEANDRLTQLAMRDQLTGLASRAAFVDVLDRAVSVARRDRTAIGVLYFDLDRFKIVNDSLGHAAGDDLLVQVAERVSERLRPADVIARLGGDEFTVLLDHLEGPYEALHVAERVHEAFNEPFKLLGRRVNVTASIGIATNTHPEDGAEELLRHADAAQYRAKETGRNRIEVFDVEFRDALLRRLDDEQALRDAIATGQIRPWFQPVVALETGAYVGAEALARWIRPDGSCLGAPAFVPLAEESGLVIALDDVIIRAAVAARVHLTALGVAPGFRIWCNVSARQLARGAPADRLATLLRRTGCAPTGIGIEITETAVMPDVETAARQIARARALGVKVALDDFGTGSSSLTLLRELAIDAVKIDRSFVNDVGVDPIDTAIVRNVAALARDLGLTVVGEGVESQQQVDLLRSLGCADAQGFLWSPAVPFEELVAMMGLREKAATVKA